MKVAVAGGFGFLGSNVVKKLQEKGHEVVPFSRKTNVDIRVFAQLDGFLSQEKPEIVINCAAHVRGIVNNSMAPVEIYEDNMLIGFNLVKGCYQNNGKKLVNVMPNYTYPHFADIYKEDNWWDGKMHDTVITYGMSPKATWVQCQAYQKKYGFNSIHIVLPDLYGPGYHFDLIRSHALGALIKKVVKAKMQNYLTVEIWGTGSPVREWEYVEDAAEGIILAMEKYHNPEILNIGEGTGFTIKEIAEMIKEVVGWQGMFIFNPSCPDGAPNKVLDVSKMKAVLNWAPKTPIKEGIEKSIRWYIDKINSEQTWNDNSYPEPMVKG